MLSQEEEQVGLHMISASFAKTLFVSAQCQSMHKPMHVHLVIINMLIILI